jgi:hypothetical protein
MKKTKKTNKQTNQYKTNKQNKQTNKQSSVVARNIAITMGVMHNGNVNRKIIGAPLALSYAYGIRAC